MIAKSRAWWNAPTGKVNESVLPYVRTVENSQAETYDKFVKLEASYDTNPRTNRYSASASMQRGMRGAKAIVTENIIAQNLDTFAANVGVADVEVRIQTDGADWSHQRTAKRLEMYLNGLSTLYCVNEKCRDALKLGSALKGTGLLKVWVNQFDEIQVEIVPVDNIIVDELECPNGNPKQLHYRDFFDREDLTAQFPEYADQIQRAQGSGDWRRWAGYRPMQSHEVVVIESWRLPIGPKGHDRYVAGRHTLCIDGCDLFDEPYEKKQFPFPKAVFNKPSRGYFGISMAERILPHQTLLNRRNYQINRSLDLKADPITYVNQADQNLAVKTTNQIGSIAVYKTAIPVTVDHQAVGKETFDSRIQIKEDARAEARISQGMATGGVPGGIESGVGVREARTSNTQPFSIQEKSFERLVLDTLWLILDCCRDLGGTKAPEILRVAKYGNKRIKWSEVDMDDLRIEMAAASTISNSPAGRQQRVVELAQAGVITLDESRELMDHPDIERVLSLYNSMVEDIEFTIERILDGEQGVVPEPFQNLKAGIVLMQKMELLAKANGAPEEILEALGDWCAIAANTLSPPPAPSPPTPAGGAMPGVGPGLPPGTPGMAVPPPPPPMPPGMMPPAPGMLQSQDAAGAGAFAPGTYAPMQG